MIGLARNATQLTAEMTEAWLYGRFTRALAEFAFERYLSFGKAYFDRNATGRLNALIDYNHDVLNLWQAVLRTCSTVLVASAYLAVMLIISWQLTLVAFVLFLAMHLLGSWFSRRNIHMANEINHINLDAGTHKWEMMAALPLFRAFAMEKEAIANYRTIADRFRMAGFRMWRLRSITARLISTGTLMVLLAMLAVAFALERANPSHMAAMLVFFFVARLAMPEFTQFQSIEAEFREKLPKAREFAALFDDRNKFIVPSGHREFTTLRDAIELHNLTFRYPEGPAVLFDINLRLEKGKTLAIVGTSGAGKSTLTHLLMRFYDVTPGMIFIDGIDIREYSTESLRRHISIVSQEVLLLNHSLRDNLCFGVDRLVSDDEIRGVLRDTQLDDLLDNLPNGLDTTLGDFGSRLSGGQRQRVAIGRALLKRAPLLILDEATSSLDSLTEARVQQAVEKALEGTTLLVIAHRLATICKADVIAVFYGGRIVEIGTLAELLDQKNLFHRMWEQQTFS